MKKKGYIIIAVLVILLIISRIKTVEMTNKYESTNKELQELIDSVSSWKEARYNRIINKHRPSAPIDSAQIIKTSQSYLYQCAKQAYWDQDGNKLAAYYKILLKYHPYCDKRNEIDDFVRRLNRRIKNDSLRAVMKFVPKELTKEETDSLRKRIAELNRIRQQQKANEEKEKMASNPKLMFGISMSKCRDIMGKPDHVSKYQSQKMSIETWTYRKKNKTVLIEFLDGKLNSYSEN